MNQKNHNLIEINVKSLHQLFDARDPAPFRERDLDDDFIDYLNASIEALQFNSKLTLKILLQEAESSDFPAKLIEDSMRTAFKYRMELAQMQFKSSYRRAQVFLLIGFVFLFICLSLARLIPTEGLWITIKEGLLIFGWVSIWKPIELVLFDWLPFFEKRRTFKRLSAAEIQIVYAQS